MPWKEDGSRKDPALYKKSGFKMKGMHHGEGTGSYAAFKKNSALKADASWDNINAAAKEAALGKTASENFGKKKGSFTEDLLPELITGGMKVAKKIAGGEEEE
tara:strand:- start:129 stop:437 length:309 start_codon:yes stop_codon:yes gene_type:complete